MTDVAAGTGPGAVPPDPGPLHAAIREARDDAAPFALAAVGILVVLALVSKHAHWDLLGHPLWWIWLVVAVPYLCLAAILLLGLSRLAKHDRRREIVIGLLALVWLFTVLGLILLVASLVAPSGVDMTGAQLLFSGVALWATNAIAFGLAFWELDCGGPVARALAVGPRKPDFQFPQDENPGLARDAWAPRLWDYVYISLTNSIAFSPTDTMLKGFKTRVHAAARYSWMSPPSRSWRSIVVATGGSPPLSASGGTSASALCGRSRL
jgi:uncharacterized membrane protein